MKEVIATIATDLRLAGPQAIRKWRERGKVSHSARLPIMLEAQGRGVPLKTSDFVFEPARESRRKAKRRQRAA
jgi:hypothetical protein